MNKLIPFSKTINFETKVAEVTDIEVTHNLIKGTDNEIIGTFILKGKYKITDESVNEQDFKYELPFSVDISDNYNLDESEFIINDFFFEIINEEAIKINIELLVDNLKENKIENRCYEKEEDLDIDDFDEINPEGIIMDEFHDNNEKLEINKNITDLFNNLNEDNEYKSYYVYIMREFDNLETIINKYKVSKEQLEMYNDLKNLKNGTKIIIPCSNE